MTTGPSLALIVGDGPNVHNDIFGFVDVFPLILDYDVIGVNRGGFHWTKWLCEVPKYWYSYHEDWLLDNAHADSILISCNQGSYFEKKPERSFKRDVVTYYDVPTAHGSSGYHAANIAISMGYSHVILIGIPLSEDYGRVYLQTWKEVSSCEFKRKVRSVSGNTAKFLGEPTYEWLNRSN